MAFSGISREVLDIAGRLRDELGRPDLAQHLARLQEREQEKLQLVSAGLEGSQEQCWGWFGGVTAPVVSPHRRHSCSWPGSRHRSSPRWMPISRRCRSSNTSKWWLCCCPPIFWEDSIPPSPSPPYFGISWSILSWKGRTHTSWSPGQEPLPCVSSPSPRPRGAQMVPSGSGGAAWPRPLGLPGLSVS